MNWLETHVWLAAWLALPVGIVTTLIQSTKSGFRELDWSRSLLYLAFLTTLAVAFTPTFNSSTRNFARDTLCVLIGFLIVDRARR